MDELLQRSAGLPEVRLAPGESLVREGETGEGLWVLVSGALQVIKHGISINVITRPGAVVGEMSLLLDSPFSATVVASDECVLRYAEDGRAFMLSEPVILRLIATGLARRLDFATTYLVDLKNQYGDAPGLAMVSEVLGHISHHQRPPASPGSARDPNPDY